MFDPIRNYFAKMRNRKAVKVRKLENSSLRTALDKSGVLAFFIPLAVWASCALFLSLQSDLPQPGSDELTSGQISPRTMVSSFDFAYDDPGKRRAAEEESLRTSPLYFRILPEKSVQLGNRIRELFRSVEARVQKREIPQSVPAEIRAVADSLDRKILDILYQAGREFHYDTSLRREVESLLGRGILGGHYRRGYPAEKTARIVDDAMREREEAKISDLPSSADVARKLAQQIAQRRLPYNIAPEERARIIGIIQNAIAAAMGDEGNLSFNAALTAKAAAERVKNLKHYESEVKRGELLIRRGETVEAAALAKMEAYKAAKNESNFLADRDWQLWRKIFMSFVLVALLSFYLYNIHPDIVTSNRRSALLAMMIILSLLFIYWSEYLFRMVSSLSNTVIPHELLAFAMPLGLIAIVMAVMLGYRVSICAAFFVASVAGMMMDESFSFALRGLSICALAGLAVRGANNYRAYFLRSILTLFPLTLLLNLSELDRIFQHGGENAARVFAMAAGWAAANSVATAMAALLLVFFVEIAFNVTTNMALMVLCDYNHPLLERLKREAPGTFFHSMMVATLAEDAAGAIKANSLKAKAAALFHDIGKLSKPQYYIENSQQMDNPHNNLTPHLSSIIIRDHVKEGLELAARYKLCRTVREAIAQHHGNDLVKYFYTKALEDSRISGGEVNESQFRYDGTPPREKETTIVSLADVCEAACRTLDKPTPAKIEEKVDVLFADKFISRQLIDSKLTLHELSMVRNSFVNTLVSMRHGRIAYKSVDTPAGPAPERQL